MKEIWQDIEEYEGIYQISNFGRIKRLYCNKKEKVLKPFIKNGYYTVRLSKKSKVKNFRVHRLIGKAFIKNPNNYNIIDHINGIKTDNKFENLEWVTHKENTRRAWQQGLCTGTKGKLGIQNKKSIKILQLKNGKVINEFYGTYEAQRITGIANSSINECCRDKRKTAGGYEWKYA